MLTLKVKQNNPFDLPIRFTKTYDHKNNDKHNLLTFNMKSNRPYKNQIARVRYLFVFMFILG